MDTYKTFGTLSFSPKKVEHIVMEAIILELFKEFKRKDGSTPMAYHSIRIGRSLAQQNESDYVVFAGYFHDVPEDIDSISSLPLDERYDILYDYALDAGLSDTDAEKAANLTLKCIYLPEEYEAESNANDKVLGKALRKQMACTRWANAERDVQVVKIADINDNQQDMLAMPKEWQDNYLSWAEPLKKTMIQKVKSHNTPSI